MAIPARALLATGLTIHLASLFLPFISFKCESPQSFFSLECAWPGFAYLAFPLFYPRGEALLVILVCSWASAVLGAGVSAAVRRLRRIGSFASLLVLPTFIGPLLVVNPDRLLGPICSTCGAALVLVSGILEVRAGLRSPDRIRSRVG